MRNEYKISIWLASSFLKVIEKLFQNGFIVVAFKYYSVKILKSKENTIACFIALK